MLKRYIFGSVTCLSSSEIHESLHSDFSEAKLVFLANSKLPAPEDYETLFVPSQYCNTSIFYDDLDERVYITNFTYIQSVLDIPVDAIAIFEQTVQVFIDGKLLVFMVEQVLPAILNESFYYALYGQPFITSGSTAPPRSPRYEESRGFFEGDSGSTELGIFSIDGSASPERQRYEEFQVTSTDIHSETEMVSDEPSTEEMVIPKFIKSTALDKKKTRETTIEGYKLTADSLLKTLVVVRNEVAISPDELNLTREFDCTDGTVSRMAAEIKNNSVLADSDPIVVYENDNKYYVLSGNRRVTAFKTQNSKKIYVTKIQTSQKDDYQLTHFFNCMKDMDYSHTYLLNILSILLNKMSLTNEVLREWTTTEKNYVFSSLFGPMTTLRFLVDVSLETSIMERIIWFSDSGFLLSNHTLREIIRKHRLNPSEVNVLLHKTWKTDLSFRKALSKVTLDLKFKLHQKKIPMSIAEDLCTIYKDDEDFADYVRSCDLRGIRGGSQKEHVISHFEKFKSGRRKRSRESVSPTVRVAESTDRSPESDYPVAVNCKKILDKQGTVTVLLIGNTTASTNDCLLNLPDKFGKIDDSGRLITHTSLSIQVKDNGSMLSGKDLSQFLLNHHLCNRSIFAIEQLRHLSDLLPNVLIEIGGILVEELALSLVMGGSNVVASDLKTAEKFDKLLKDHTFQASQLL